MDNKNICDKIQVERYLLNQMGQEEETRFQEHLSQCESCRDYLTKIRAIATIVGENDLPDIQVSTFQKKKIQMSRWLSVAACILFAICISVFLHTKQQTADEVLYPTSIEYRNRASGDQVFVKLLYPDHDSICVPSSRSVLFRWDSPCTYQLKIRYKDTILLDVKGNGSEYALSSETFALYPYITWDLKVDEQSYSGQIIFSNN
ncbi:MAG: zf-HC2 domain-containing protein [Parabacteroides sp.]|nr:zf-HC2 domain-containing protein [Parabacteroides sp.]